MFYVSRNYIRPVYLKINKIKESMMNINDDDGFEKKNRQMHCYQP